MNEDYKAGLLYLPNTGKVFIPALFIPGFIYLLKLPGDAMLYDYPDEMGCEVYISLTD
jgi:hypothetical protein